MSLRNLRSSITKAAAVLALTAAIGLGLSQPASASELRTTEPAPTVVVADASTSKAAAADLDGRLATDPRLARQVQSAAQAGDTATASSLLGYDVVGIDNQGSTVTEANRVARVTIEIEVSCHTHANGTLHCTIRITVTVTPIFA